MEIETDFLRRRTLREPAETGKICLGEPGSFKEENPCSPKSPWNPKFSHLPLLMGYLLVPSTRHTWKGVSLTPLCCQPPPAKAPRVGRLLPQIPGLPHLQYRFLRHHLGAGRGFRLVSRHFSEARTVDRRTSQGTACLLLPSMGKARLIPALRAPPPPPPVS